MADTILISVAEFTRLYNLSKTTFYEEVKKKRLPVVKRGRRTFVASDDAAAWLEALRNTSAKGGNNGQ